MNFEKDNVRIEYHEAFKVCGKKVWISGQDNSQFTKFWEEAHESGMVQELKDATNPAENVTKSDILGVSCVEKNPSVRAFDFYIASEWWLPQSGYSHAFAPELEVYLAEDKDTVEFWLPIMK